MKTYLCLILGILIVNGISASDNEFSEKSYPAVSDNEFSEQRYPKLHIVRTSDPRSPDISSINSDQRVVGITIDGTIKEIAIVSASTKKVIKKRSKQSSSSHS